VDKNTENKNTDDKIIGFKTYERKTNAYKHPKERVKTFDEFIIPISEEERKKQAARCMDSHAWEPTPSTTTFAPLFLIQNRSAARPLKNAFPIIAPYNTTLPTMMLSSSLHPDSSGGIKTIIPPDNPFPA
jgi:hypothetical protein